MEKQIKDFRGAIDQSKEPTRNYTQGKSKSFSIPPVARFKCKVYFLDGNSKTFYSYDDLRRFDGQMIKDEWKGLTKLYRMVDKWEGKYKTVMIWANLDDIPKTMDGNYDFQVTKITRYGTEHNPNLHFNQNTGTVHTHRVKQILAKEWHLSQYKGEKSA